MDFRKPDKARPSYQQGFATHQASEKPGLWKDNVFAIAPFLGNTGKKILDWGGFKNDVTVNSGVTWVRDPNGDALSFDATNSGFLDLGVPGWNHSTGTILVWLKTSSVGAGILLGITSGVSPNNFLTFFTFANAVNFQMRTTVQVIDISNPLDADGLWHRVAMVQDGTTCKMYIDAVLQADTDSGEWFADIAGALSNFRIGNILFQGGTFNRFDGEMGPFEVYGNRTFSQKEIIEDYLDTQAKYRKAFSATFSVPVIVQIAAMSKNIGLDPVQLYGIGRG